MLKIIFIFIFGIFLLNGNSFAQEVKKDAKTFETKMDQFASKSGVITKFTDTNLPNLKTSYGAAETRIRKVNNGGDALFFYQISKSGQYSTNTASIEYSDLIEVIKAIKILKSDEEKDIALNPDYLENKFTTIDGFQVGYYISKGKSTWYLKLEKYGSDNNTLFVKDGNTIESAFNDAKAKIDELKK